MPGLVSPQTAEWIREQMGRGSGFDSRRRRIVHSSHGSSCVMLGRVTGGTSDGFVVQLLPNGLDGEPGDSVIVNAVQIGFGVSVNQLDDPSMINRIVLVHRLSSLEIPVETAVGEEED